MTAVAISMPGTGEWVVLALLALLIFGPQRLPELARGLGRSIARLKAEATSTMDELKQSVDAEGLSDVAKDLRGTTEELKRTATLAGPVASGARPIRSGESTVTARPEGPAPYDPDAT
jgi:TatA/E family protein of Tat protein translocase